MEQHKTSISDEELIMMDTITEDSDFEFIELALEIRADDHSDQIESDDDIVGNQQLIERTGPSVRDYLEMLFEYLKTRLRYIQTYFRAPIRLQKLLEQMQFLRLPRTLWQTFINISMRLIALSGIQFDIQTLCETLILIVTIVAELYISSFFLKVAVGLFAYIGPTYLAQIISFIYNFLNDIAKKLWDYVKKRLDEFYKLSSECIIQYSFH